MSLCDLKCLPCKLEMLSDVRITLYDNPPTKLTLGPPPLHKEGLGEREWGSPSLSVVGLPTTPTIPQMGRHNTTLNLNNIKRKEK